jgi:hypothetical protein
VIAEMDAPNNLHCSDVARGSNRCKPLFRLKMSPGEFAEILIATSGVIALVMIVLIMTMMVRVLRLFHAR